MVTPDKGLGEVVSVDPATTAEHLDARSGHDGIGRVPSRKRHGPSRAEGPPAERITDGEPLQRDEGLFEAIIVTGGPPWRAHASRSYQLLGRVQYQ